METNSYYDVDVQAWKKQLTVPSIIIKTEETSNALKNYKEYVLDVNGVKPVMRIDEKYNRLLLKGECDTNEFKSKYGLDNDISFYTVIIEPKARNYQEILREALPEEDIVPGSFEVFGDIAIIYLKSKQLPYKYIIGKAILVTHSKLKTVLNKTDKLDNVFRNPELELIAGEDKRETEVKEESVKMKLNVGEVYFCTRLMSERARVISTLSPKDVIVDVFCGIGPFALRAAKEKQCVVYANDLNPKCYKYLNINRYLNRMEDNIKSFCLDGRQFIKQISEMVSKGDIKQIDHIYMNLPALSIEFLDAFRDFDFDSLPCEPVFHLYCFEELEDDENLVNEKVKARILESLDTKRENLGFIDFHSVKNVSLKKAYLCVTFRYLPYCKLSPNKKIENNTQNKKVKLV